MKSLFITFEGGEGSGKTTLIERLYEALKKRGLDALKTREPGGCLISDEIRHTLLSKHPMPMASKTELFLYLASRSQHVQDVIAPALKGGKIVLCDRFNDSTVAYQGAARQIDLPFVKALCRFSADGIVPDLTLFIDIDPAEGLKRVRRQSRDESLEGEGDRIEEEALEFHHNVRAAYQSLLSDEPDRFARIDGSASPDDVFQSALHIIEAKL